MRGDRNHEITKIETHSRLHLNGTLSNTTIDYSLAFELIAGSGEVRMSEIDVNGRQSGTIWLRKVQPRASDG